MLSAGWLPLALGLGATSVLIAYTDLRRGWLYLSHFVPAGLGIAWFAYRIPFSLLTWGILAATSVPVTYATLKFFEWEKARAMKKAGRETEPSMVSTGGDYLAMALFAFWPYAWSYVVVGACILAFLGAQARWWNVGKRGAPLAGLMGVSFLAWLVWAVVV
ncbi:MAG: hypothetical protein JRN50_02335 [Nitrososphaerota archaeon]|nr:hypothetical protein [Nitrososphaerota archaeon]